MYEYEQSAANAEEIAARHNIFTDKDGNPLPDTILSRGVVPQRDGLRSIAAFLSGEPFETVKPFIIESLNTDSKLPNAYIIGNIDDKQTYLTITPQTTEVLLAGNAVLSIPKSDDLHYYQWLDFYPVEGQVVDTQHVLGSIRLDAGHKRLLSRGWYGYERQLLIDYLTGERPIDPIMLKPFTASTNRFQTVTFGYSNGKPLLVKVNGLESPNGEPIRFIPKFDELRGYVWLDGYRVNDAEQEKVLSRRINSGVPTLVDAWKGPDVQAMIDWVATRLPIQLVTPVQFDIHKESPRITLEDSAERQIAFDFKGNAALKEAKKVTLVPGEDELYRWIEIHRRGNAEEAEKVVTYYRVLTNERKKLQGFWIGPQKQRFHDYTAGKITFEHLKTVTLPVSTHAIISLGTVQGHHLNLQLNDPYNFPKGKDVILTPSLSHDGELIVEVTTADSDVLKRFIFDRATNSFRVANASGIAVNKPVGYWKPERVEAEVIKLYEQRHALDFTSRHDLYEACRKYPGGLEALAKKLGIPLRPQVNKTTGRYVDSNGKAWVAGSRLGNELGFTAASAIRILAEANLPTQEGRSIAGQSIILYDAEVAEGVLRASGYLDRKAAPRSPKVTLEDQVRSIDPKHPTVVREKGGKIRWHYRGNTAEQDTILGINNIQALFLQAYPQFDELFPRNEQNVINEALRTAARDFIVTNIGTLSTFEEALHLRPDSLRGTAYFKKGLVDILAKSFSPWGIEWESEQVLRRIGVSSTNEVIEATGQQAGIRGLRKYLLGQCEYDEVQPFIINIQPGDMRTSNRYDICAIQGESDEKHVILTLNTTIMDVLRNDGTIIGIPKQDKYYQWLEFYEVSKNDQIDANSILGSYLIGKEAVKINTTGWYGPETQLLLEYLAEKRPIDPQDLKAFTADLHGAEGRYYCDIGHIDKRHLRINIGDINNPDLASQQLKTATFRPNYDADRGYIWYDGYIKGSDGNDVLVCSKRAIPGAVKLESWKGKEIQSIIDWVDGDLSFDQTLPANIILDNKSLVVVLETSDQRKIMIQFMGNKQLKQHDTLQLIPKSDGVYEWLDVYKLAHKPEDNVLITRARIARDKRFRLQANWFGPEKQMELDGMPKAAIASDNANQWLQNLLGEEIE